MLELNLLHVLLFFMLIVLLAIGYFYSSLFVKATYNAKKTALTNSAACKKALREHKVRLWTDYFWSEPKRFSWITLSLLLFVALGIAIAYRAENFTTSAISLLFSFIFFVITVAFLHFSRKSFYSFEEKAATRLKEFEAQVTDAINKEISFNGDNIQSFSDKDEEFDTQPKVFSFPVEVTKIAFPPLEKNAKKHKIIATRKLEFLILSREFFSICKSASKFDLLNPAREGVPKKCAEKKAGGGECHEHYYSQMRNVEYDSKKECIRIIYYDDRDNVEFPCKKAAPNRKPAMKALKEKLRLTERQRLRKIDEHEKFEEIKNRRDLETPTEDENSDK